VLQPGPGVDVQTVANSTSSRSRSLGAPPGLSPAIRQPHLLAGSPARGSYDQSPPSAQAFHAQGARNAGAMERRSTKPGPPIRRVRWQPTTGRSLRWHGSRPSDPPAPGAPLHIHALLDAAGSPKRRRRDHPAHGGLRWVPAALNGMARGGAFAERGSRACLNPHPFPVGGRPRQFP